MVLFSKKGDIELDEIVKIILAGILLLVLFYIITVYVTGGFSEQSQATQDVFSMLS